MVYNLDQDPMNDINFPFPPEATGELDRTAALVAYAGPVTERDTTTVDQTSFYCETNLKQLLQQDIIQQTDLGPLDPLIYNEPFDSEEFDQIILDINFDSTDQNFLLGTDVDQQTYELFFEEVDRIQQTRSVPMQEGNLSEEFPSVEVHEPQIQIPTPAELRRVTFTETNNQMTVPSTNTTTVNNKRRGSFLTPKNIRRGSSSTPNHTPTHTNSPPRRRPQGIRGKIKTNDVFKYPDINNYHDLQMGVPISSNLMCRDFTQETLDKLANHACGRHDLTASYDCDRMRYIRHQSFVDFLNRINDIPNVAYGYEENESNIYKSDIVRYYTNDQGDIYTETRQGLCPFCPEISFHKYKDSKYSQHISFYHGVNERQYVYPNPRGYGRYMIGKPENEQRTSQSKQRVREGAVCPSCHEIIELGKSATTKKCLLYSYYRHFRHNHTTKGYADLPNGSTTNQKFEIPPEFLISQKRFSNKSIL